MEEILVLPSIPPARLPHFHLPLLRQPNLDYLLPTLSPTHLPGIQDNANGSDEEVTLEEGSTFLIRYSAVRKYIVDGDVELI